MAFLPEVLELTRTAREGVVTAVAADLPSDDRGLHVDRALDNYAEALTALFGEGWRRYAVVGNDYLATRIGRGY